MAELTRQEGTFPASDNTKLYWTTLSPPSPKAHIALVHGYAEHIGRYAHVMEHLANAGYAVHGFDVRGHGKSEGQRGHVKSFDQYLDDLELGIQRVKIAAGDKPVFLMGHSHGSLIATRYALRQPPGIKGVVLSGPFFRLKLKPPPLKLYGALAMGKILPFLPVGNEIQSEQLTRDPEMVEKHRKDPLNFATTTPGWFVAARGAQQEVLEGAAAMKLPFAIFAGGADPIADTSAGQGFYEQASSADKTFKSYPDALHEIFNETNRADVLKDVTDWLDKRV